MTQREKVIVAFLLLIAAFLGGLVGRWTAKSSVDAPIALRIAFDGGYTFDFERADAVNVHALKKGNYAMKLRRLLHTGQVPDIELNGYKLSILPDGSAPVRMKPKLPPYDPTQVPCDGPHDRLVPNNRLFIPNLLDIAARMGTTVKTQLDSAAIFELTGGGAVSVHEVGGCVQLGDHDGNPIGDVPTRSMVSGNAGVVFEWQHVAWKKIVLQRTPLNGGTPLLTELTPDSDKTIKLLVSAFLPGNPNLATTKAGDPIAHFKAHFDDVFTHVDEAKRILLIWKGAYFDSPGIDCPGGGI